MRITLIARNYWPVVGGVESFLRHVAHGLARDHDVEVLAQSIDGRPGTQMTGSLLPFPAFEPFCDGGVKVRQLKVSDVRRAAMVPLGLQVVPLARRYVYGQLRRGLAAIYARAVGPVIAREARGTDVLHVWSGDLLAAGSVRAGAIAGLPTVVTPFVHPGGCNDDPASAAAYRRADRVIGLLETDAHVLRGLGVKESRVAVSGVCSPGMARGGGRAIRKAFDVRGGLVVFLGVRRPYKGFDLLLQAAELLPDGEGAPTIAFLGPGPKIGPTASGARVIDVGEVDDEGKAAWLEAADLLCLPSEFEIFPVSILEAWSARTPVLVTDIPPLRELVEGSGGGLTIERRADAIAVALARCLADPDGLRRMGDAGWEEWSRRYTIDAVVGWHEDEYMRLVGARNGTN